jgi:hypothetical protein
VETFLSATDHSAAIPDLSTERNSSIDASGIGGVANLGRVGEGLQALYTFDATGANDTVLDVSGVGNPLNLTIAEPSNVVWGDDGFGNGVLTITDDTLISSLQPATKLINAITKSNELTIEAWVAPENLNQSGPARIASLSGNGRNRNFTLGQEGNAYSVRLRTSSTNNNGTGNGSVTSPAGSATTGLTHVVYTREADGDASLYVDNKLVTSKKVTGDLSNWNQDYRFALANELTGKDAWKGTFDLVAVYSQAFDAAEVNQNFLSGSDATGGNPVTPPPVTPPVTPPPLTPAPPVTPPVKPPAGVQLWSSLNIKAGQKVTIEKGQTVLLDTDTANLDLVTVKGKLIFGEKFVDLNKNGVLDFTADSLWIDGGHLEIGTESDAYDAKTTITLDGQNDDTPTSGGRALLVSNKGILDLHGVSQDKISWTQLSANVNAGSAVIKLAESVNWQAGDAIVIAPSGFDANEAEQRTVKSVSADGKTITLNAALSYSHWGTIETVGGKPLDMRAEVGLLTRNIKVQGSADSESSQYGAHTMILGDTTARVSGVEFYRSGQLGLKGRYAWHWHEADDGTGEYFKNSSVHNSFQRGIVVHDTNNVTIESNVVYNVTSHAYVFSEDGGEVNNKFIDNLGVLVKKPDAKDFVFPVDQHFTSSQAEHRPSVFWGRNYYNTLIGNHAAGTIDGIGFFFDAALMPQEENSAIIKRSDPIAFRDNVAHSNMINPKMPNPHYGPLTRGIGLMVNSYDKRKTPGSEIRFEDFTTYKNNLSGVWIEDDRHVLSNAVIADGSTGVVTMRSTIEDTVIAQRTANKIGGVMGVDHPFLEGGGATAGGIHIKRSTYGINPNIRDVTFVDFARAGIVVHKQTTMGAGSTVQGLKFVNTPRLFWEVNKGRTNVGTLVDLDGSLTGLSGAKVSGSKIAGGTFNTAWNAYIAK